MGEFKSRYIGEVLDAEDLQPGDYFIGSSVGSSALGLSMGDGLAVFLPRDSGGIPETGYIAHYCGPVIRRLTGEIVAEPMAPAGDEPDPLATAMISAGALALLPSGLAVTFKSNNHSIGAVDLGSGDRVAAVGAVAFFPAWRLLWRDAGEEVEICRVG